VRRRRLRRCALGLLLLAGCAGDQGVAPLGDGEPHPLLSHYGLFEGPLRELRPADGVLPYTVNTELFSDGARKRRFVWVPPGSAARYQEHAAFDFPEGAILIKNFSYPAAGADFDAGERLVETRLLVRGSGGWRGLPYIWNAEQSDAELRLGGAVLDVVVSEPGAELQRIDYVVPDANTCAYCHEEPGHFAPLGTKARHLNLELSHADGSENQLTRWRRAGILAGGPAPRDAPRTPRAFDPSDGSLAERARGWLDINCASCHSPAGRAGSSGLFLGIDVTDPLALGILKPPVSAGTGTGGRKFSIVPGAPDESILLHRMESTEPGVAMPELGRQLVPRAAVDLIRAWIEGLG